MSEPLREVEIKDATHRDMRYVDGEWVNAAKRRVAKKMSPLQKLKHLVTESKSLRKHPFDFKRTLHREDGVKEHEDFSGPNYPGEDR